MSVILVSGNIRYVRIFPGVPWKGGVKRQCRLSTMTILANYGRLLARNLGDKNIVIKRR